MENNLAIMKEIKKYYIIWQEYNFVYEEWAKKNNLSVNSLLILCDIYDNKEDCTQKKISQKWLIPKQTINTILKDFERRGFVKLLPSPENKRNKVIQFTSEGKEYADSIISKLRKIEISAMEEIGVDYMKELNKKNFLFIKTLKKMGGKNEKNT